MTRNYLAPPPKPQQFTAQWNAGHGQGVENPYTRGNKQQDYLCLSMDVSASQWQDVSLRVVSKTFPAPLIPEPVSVEQGTTLFQITALVI